MDNQRSLFLHILGIDGEDAKSIEAAAREFPLALASLIDREPVRFAMAPNWIESVFCHRRSELGEVIIDLMEEFHERKISGYKVLIVCRAEHVLARLARKSNRDARWGGANRNGQLGLVYGNWGKFVIWHELLHLYGADDCYVLPDHGPNCGTPRCIMQYAATPANTGPGLVLCRNNRAEVNRGFAHDRVND